MEKSFDYNVLDLVEDYNIDTSRDVNIHGEQLSSQ